MLYLYSFEEGESAFLCQLALAQPACAPCSNNNNNNSSSRDSWHVDCLGLCQAGKRQAPSKLRFTLPAGHAVLLILAHVPRGSAGRRDGWTCALFLCFTQSCRSITRALTSAGELRDFILKGRWCPVCHLQSWYLPVRIYRPLVLRSLTY